MDWTVPYIVYRFSDKVLPDEVFYTHDMKKAKYWITYIAEIGDVLVRTPMHPKHKKATTQAEYMYHKDSSGTASSSQDSWMKMMKEKKLDPKLPPEQLRADHQDP